LDLHLSESAGQSSDHLLKGSLVDINLDDDTEVEHELIAFILLILDADWVAEDAVLIVGIADGNVTVAEGLAGNDVFGHRLKVKQTWLVNIRLWDNTSWRALVDDSGSWSRVSQCYMYGVLKKKIDSLRSQAGHPTPVR